MRRSRGLGDVYKRQDVEQADLTPLMASWLGLPVPANSEGRLPLDLLNASPAYRARAALATAKQVLEVYRVKYVDRASRMLHFQPFQPLQSRGDTLPGAARVADAEQAIRDGEFDVAMEESEALILSLIHISEPTRPSHISRMPSSA